jgi:hypothetical protein
MHIVTSFHSSAVRADQLSAIMADYIALERARTYRRLFVRRFGVLALVVAIASTALHWFSSIPLWLSVGFCLVAPVSAWVAELRCDWRLARRLEQVPEAAAHLVAPRTKVIKSS